MILDVVVRRNEYFDSVFLMGINNRIMKEEGVVQSAVLMGSDANKEVLQSLGFVHAKIDAASANDLIVAVLGEAQKNVDAVLSQINSWLTEVKEQKEVSALHSLDEAIGRYPHANLVSISVPGEYAAGEARKCLDAGMNVFLFSDNVSVEDEVTLKQTARQKNLLVMGPDCGTSIIGGVGLGFSNAVRKGYIGVIAAAGTGLQEFSCMVHNAGFGISHAIGTGGRDLTDAVGGLTTFSALDLLEKDANTKVIVIVSKPPGLATLKRLVERFKTIKKPIVGCFIGIDGRIEGQENYFKRAAIIDEAVALSIQQLGEMPRHSHEKLDKPPRMEKHFHPDQIYLRGIFAGGTFCFQAQQILKGKGIGVFSNAPMDRSHTLIHPDQSIENTIVDMGDEYYMVGRPHPMIDGSQRAVRILREAKDPSVAVILLDFILGYNAAGDPVGELVDAIQQAQGIARQAGRQLVFVASICGTEGDQQDKALQVKMLMDCGVIVFESNAGAVDYCAGLLKEISDARTK